MSLKLLKPFEAFEPEFRPLKLLELPKPDKTSEASEGEGSGSIYPIEDSGLMKLPPRSFEKLIEWVRLRLRL